MGAWDDDYVYAGGPTLTRRKGERMGFLGLASTANPEEQDGPVSDAQLARAVSDQRRRQAARRRMTLEQREALGLVVRGCEYHMGEALPCAVCGDRP